MRFFFLFFVSAMTNHLIQRFQVEGRSFVRFHQAKEFSSLPHMLAHQRDTFISKASYKSTDPWTRWLQVREAIDPQGIFLNPYLRQLFALDANVADNGTYTPPNALPLRPQGLMDHCDDTLTLLAQLKPFVPGANNNYHAPVLVGDVRLDVVEPAAAAAAAPAAAAANGAAAPAAPAAAAAVAVVPAVDVAVDADADADASQVRIHNGAESGPASPVVAAVGAAPVAEPAAEPAAVEAEAAAVAVSVDAVGVEVAVQPEQEQLPLGMQAEPLNVAAPAPVV
jgi:hypothetical protein